MWEKVIVIIISLIQLKWIKFYNMMTSQPIGNIDSTGKNGKFERSPIHGKADRQFVFVFKMRHIYPNCFKTAVSIFCLNHHLHVDSKVIFLITIMFQILLMFCKLLPVAFKVC